MSNVQQEDPFFDFERDILAPNRTPPLTATKPNFNSLDSPPPLVPYDPSSDSTDTEEANGSSPKRSRRVRKGRTHASLADGVLIRHLDPNQTEVAAYVEKHALPSASQSEAEEEDEAEGAHLHTRAHNEVLQNAESGAPNQTKDPLAILDIMHDNGDKNEKTANDDQRDDFPMVYGEHDRIDEKSLQSPSNVGQTPQDRPPTPPGPQRRSSKRWDFLPPPRPPPLAIHEHSLDINDSLVKSPAIGKYTIMPPDAPPDVILPAMQMSPPRSSPAGSPGYGQTLPPLRTAVGQIHDSTSTVFPPGMSPMFSRPSPGFTQTPVSYPSPHYPGMSPPGPPAHFTWRSSTRDSSMSNSSSDHMSAMSAAASTPASSLMAPSPAASQPQLSTLREQQTGPKRAKEDSPVQTEPEPRPGLRPEPEGAEADPGSPQGSMSTFKCNFPGCTAAPFHTQYLLNSHKNVHSNQRPHFCPVPGCQRGPGGQGFKRKNEMIRHGLVHTSPGYICPFCPDQQHKYPRPDNLQRHVKVHHTDRHRDDPELREVLDQRAEGGNRGRRRRMAG